MRTIFIISVSASGEVLGKLIKRWDQDFVQGLIIFRNYEGSEMRVVNRFVDEGHTRYDAAPHKDFFSGTLGISERVNRGIQRTSFSNIFVICQGSLVDEIEDFVAQNFKTKDVVSEKVL